ncbi:MAG: TRAP transporter substrate-binding protein [Acetobacteraceae bacterium]|nr:TRAP transporter substrate-binding protein [Acetobacteraceae bacterium]
MSKFDQPHIPFLVTRRWLLAGTGSIAAPLLLAIGSQKAHGADPEFRLKLGDDLPLDHPLNVHLSEAAKQVAERSGGRLVIELFANNQLGGDTDMMSQLRSGALEMMSLSGNILSTLLPLAGIYNLPFAFSNYDQVWATMDGPLGKFLRAKLEGIGLHALDKQWDNGFRQITSGTRKIETPSDLQNFKIRVPVSPLWLSMFKALGAAPTAINFSEVYSALQTHVVDGQENPLPLIETAKLYEVQKYAALTSHIWDSFYLLISKRVWQRLPPDLQAILADTINQAALAQRRDMQELNSNLQIKLTQQGMEFTHPDRAAFRQALIKAGFYAGWKQKYGEDAWNLLQQTSDKLG